MGREDFLGGTRIRNRDALGDYKPRGTEPTTVPDLVNSPLSESLPILFCAKEEKSQPIFVCVEFILLTLQKTQLQVYEPLVEDILGGVRLGGEHGPGCGKICSCLTLEMTTRKGRKAWERDIKIQKADTVFVK